VSLAIDAAGNVYLAGTFTGRVDFGGGPVSTLDTGGTFVASFTDTCAHRWSRSLDVPARSSPGPALAVSAGGEAFVTGTIGAHIYLMGLAADGHALWTRGYDPSWYNGGVAVATDAYGQVFATGYFSTPIDFGGGPLMPNAIPSMGSADTYLVSFDGSGAYRWSRALASRSLTLAMVPMGLAAGPSGDLALAGTIEGSVDFGEGPLPRGFFVAGYDGHGQVRWGRTAGNSPSSDTAADVAMDADGNVWVAGRFGDTIGFDDGTLTSAGGHDGFVTGFTSQGCGRGSRRFGAGGRDQAEGVATGPGGLVVAGSFEGTVDFGDGPQASAGEGDVFVVTLSQ
jgi:hypothetical protein